MLQHLMILIASTSSVILLFCIVEIVASRHPRTSLSDFIIDLFTFVIPSNVGNILVYGLAALTFVVLPNEYGALASTPWWAQFLAFLVLEDMIFLLHRSFDERCA